MGTTIRREPITTAIPAAPDYRFLNITNFGGIEKSSNPFVVSSNTASDCLNVYVDEDNALSTRPRLQHQTDFIKDIINKFPALGLTGAFDLIGVYDLHDGYLIHGVEDDVYYMFKYEDKNSIYQITGTEIPTEKCKIFEQNDVIYVLDGQKYLNVKNFVISEVEGYVPTTRVGKTNTTDGTPFESPNVLSNSYKESFTWNQTWSLSEITNDESAIENKYSKVTLESRNWKHEDVKAIYPKNNGKIGLLRIIQNNELYEHTYTPSEDSWTSSKITLPFNPSGTDFIDVTATPDGSIIAMRHWNTTNATAGGVYVRRNDTWTKLSYNESFSAQETGGMRDSIKINSDGSVILAMTTDTVAPSEKLVLLAFEYVADAYKKYIVEYDHARYSDDYTLNGIDLSPNGVWAFLKSVGTNTGTGNYLPAFSHLIAFEIKPDEDSDKITVTDDKHTIFKDTNYYIDFVANNTSFAIVEDTDVNPKIKYYETISQTSDVYTLQATDFNGKSIPTFHPIFHNNRLYVSEGFFDLDSKKYIQLVFGDSIWKTNNFSLVQNFGSSPRFMTDTLKCDWLIEYDLSDASITTYLRMISFDAYGTEPSITITKTFKTSDENYEEWNSLSELFMQSKLTTRFDNNTWFASNNYTFHTLYNDPTYIPLTSYNDLGESFEPITGLSIVNDNILAAYKRNRIYIITPITVGNELTYSYTETKNIIGNDVVDAPTLTILTEMPILISYNGIYALNQLENVQSSDRITTLIGEAMNPKWLKESSSDIDKCLVLNRLYWTYFILPHKKSTNGLIKDNNHTKVYLLDNRTGSWFYWELPIYVISAMIKNNKTHFVTEDGELFTLETTDIINKFNKDLTEYYDDLKKPTLIPWNWTSQILSLNTINYSKRLVDTTFVLTDTDMSDEYALNYKFKAFRKNKNAETTELTLANDIEYVESITKRTMIPRFNFLQFTLSNTEDDQKLNNNKLRLVGLGLKYVLLGGLY